MKNYIIRQNRMNDKQYIQFKAVASGRYALHSKYYEKGKNAYFEAMQLSNGEVCLWVDVGVQFVGNKYHHPVNLKLLKRIPAEKQLSFDELYTLALQHV